MRRRGGRNIVRGGGIARQAIERQPRAQAGRVGQQVADGHGTGGAAVELRHVAHDRGVEVHAPALDEQHERRGGSDDLGERRDVPQRAIDVRRRAAGRPRQPPVSLREQNRVPPAHDEYGPRVGAALDAIEHEGVERWRVERRGLEQQQRR